VPVTWRMCCHWLTVAYKDDKLAPQALLFAAILLINCGASMEPVDVKQLIEAAIPDSEVIASGDGSHFDVTVISNAFEGQSMVAKQRLVYASLGDSITSGAIHAINIKAYTPDEWKSASKLQIS
jgi:acid stress-induced BolA-like protein IbaG/YrbA